MSKNWKEVGENLQAAKGQLNQIHDESGHAQETALPAIGEVAGAESPTDTELEAQAASMEAEEVAAEAAASDIVDHQVEEARPEAEVEAEAASPKLQAARNFVRDLRAIADFYDQHPEVKLPYLGTINVFNATKAELKVGAKAFGKSDKSFNGEYFLLSKMFGTLKLEFFTNREQVCEKVKVREEIVPEHILPAREETLVPERTIDIFEWHCGSLLAPDEPKEE